MDILKKVNVGDRSVLRFYSVIISCQGGTASCIKIKKDQRGIKGQLDKNLKKQFLQFSL